MGDDGGERNGKLAVEGVATDSLIRGRAVRQGSNFRVRPMIEHPALPLPADQMSALCKL